MFGCGVWVSVWLFWRGWRWKTPGEPVGLYSYAVFRLSGALEVRREGGLQPAAPFCLIRCSGCSGIHPSLDPLPGAQGHTGGQ